VVHFRPRRSHHEGVEDAEGSPCQAGQRGEPEEPVGVESEPDGRKIYDHHAPDHPDRKGQKERGMEIQRFRFAVALPSVPRTPCLPGPDREARETPSDRSSGELFPALPAGRTFIAFNRSIIPRSLETASGKEWAGP